MLPDKGKILENGLEKEQFARLLGAVWTHLNGENFIGGFRSIGIYDFTVVSSLKVNWLSEILELEQFKKALENYRKAQRSADNATVNSSSTDSTSAIECEAPSISSQNEQSSPIACTSTLQCQTTNISGNDEPEISPTIFHLLGDCSFEQLLLNRDCGDQNSTPVPTKCWKIAIGAEVLTCQDIKDRAMTKNPSNTIV